MLQDPNNFSEFLRHAILFIAVMIQSIEKKSYLQTNLLGVNNCVLQTGELVKVSIKTCYWLNITLSVIIIVRVMRKV